MNIIQNIFTKLKYKTQMKGFRMKKINVDLKIIGTVHSPYKKRSEAPPQGTDELCEIEIYNEFEQGLKDIEGFSHIHVFCWFHKSEGYNLNVQTPWDTEPHGVFVTRSPSHPNPIGYTTAELIDREKNVLKVKGLAAIEGTPVIDIKPYIKKIDCKPDSISGWCENIGFKF